MQYSFNNSRKIPKLAQFIPQIYNNFYYKILGYFWGVTTPITLSSQPRSRSTTKAENPLGEAVGQPLAIVPITVWNLSTRSVRSPSRRAEESKRKDPGSESGRDGDSLLLNAELAAGAVLSILKDFDLKRSKTLPVDEALALGLQGVASVSPCVLSCLFPF